MTLPARGEIWQAVLNPTRGREQRGRRPVLVVSTDLFSQGPAELVVVLPVTSKDKGIPWHVEIDPPEGGLKTTSHVMCEAIRSISRDRLVKRWGVVSDETMAEIEQRLQMLLQL
ncbi:MAG: type II toxin-antitoxin system PemK/MazF family toxin [Planctomycetaceae bacterium]|nr:type II toxin-antitoxin system PemK/MazF family toxin [Planctomycetaceae bacterium]